MADRDLFTRECAANEAAAIAQSITNTLVPTPAPAKLRLFDGTLIPDENTTQAELEAAETTLPAPEYPVGGYDIDALLGPADDPLGGVDLFTPLQVVPFGGVGPFTIGGAWIEDANGDVRRVFIFDPQKVLAAAGQAFPFVRALVIGRNALVV